LRSMMSTIGQEMRQMLIQRLPEIRSFLVSEGRGGITLF